MTTEIRVGIDEPDEAATAEINTVSVLDELREALSSDVEVELLYLPVPNRGNIRMVYRPFIDFDDLKRWTKQSRESRKPDAPVDQKKFSSIILAETCVGLQMKRKGDDDYSDLTDAKGNALTYKSGMVQDMLKSTMGGWFQAVEKMYKSDGHILLTARTVLESAGYADWDLGGDGDPLA